MQLYRMQNPNESPRFWHYRHVRKFAWFPVRLYGERKRTWLVRYIEEQRYINNFCDGGVWLVTKRRRIIPRPLTTVPVATRKCCNIPPQHKNDGYGWVVYCPVCNTTTLSNVSLAGAGMLWDGGVQILTQDDFDMAAGAYGENKE